MGAALCDIGGCGVQAIGRCNSCANAFCASHQGYKGSGINVVALVNRCAPCVANAAIQRRSQVEAVDPEHVKAEFEAALRRLIEAGSPGLTPRVVVIGRRKTRFKGWVDITEERRPGWSLGLRNWRVTYSESGDKDAGMGGLSVTKTKHVAVETFLVPTGEIEANFAPGMDGFPHGAKATIDATNMESFLARHLSVLADRLLGPSTGTGGGRSRD